MTAATLRRIMPNAGLFRSMMFAPRLTAAMERFCIDTPARQAAFLAQIAHESGELRYREEIASGEAYEGRISLGNVVAGDGKRFKGRGLIQLTGRRNYSDCGKALGYDLIANPDMLSQYGLSCLSAAWFWASRGLNKLADAGDFDAITKIINGGTNGAQERKTYWRRAKAVLGA